jgi:hypothetical protein
MVIRRVGRTLVDAFAGHAGPVVGIAGVLITGGAFGLAVGIAETERDPRQPPFAHNLWFDLGVVLAVMSVVLAMLVLAAILDRADYGRRIGRQLLHGRDLRLRCFADDADDRYDALKGEVDGWASDTVRILRRDPAHEVEFTRGGHLAVSIPGGASERIRELIIRLDRLLDRLSGIGRSL